MKKSSTVTIARGSENAFIDRAWAAIRGSADDLREKGFRVAVHNDYMLDGKRFTFWLLTTQRGDGPTMAFKGEAETDAEALDQVRAAWAEYSDKLHHAPAGEPLPRAAGSDRAV